MNKKKVVIGAFFVVMAIKILAAELVEIEKINPHIKIDLIYATPYNFTNQIIYKSQEGNPIKCYLVKDAAQALSEIQEDLEKQGFGLKVWDAYRPLSAQQKMWDALADNYPDEKEREKYVSNPKNGGGRHPRGMTVDCTLIDKEGNEVEKATAFDYFGPEAASDYEGPSLTPTAKKHRNLLKVVMEKHGFKGIKSEWWHFDYQGWEKYPPLDIEI